MKRLLLFLLFLTGILFSNAQQKNGSCWESKAANNKSKSGTYSINAAPENLRSDTADILKYTISLNITDFTNNTISGSNTVRFVPRINGLNYLCLDLISLTTDSVVCNLNQLSFQHNGSLLKIDLPAAFSTNDTLDLTVFYHGVPGVESGGSGGWTMQGGSAYSIGQSYYGLPSAFGRAWYPCFDNQVERAAYEFIITTDSSMSSYCGGVLTHDTINSNGLRTRTWVLNDEVPSYLASVAVSAYAEVNQVMTSVSGPLPAVFAAMPADTTNLKNSFVNLQHTLSLYESFYGSYIWDRIGYVVTGPNAPGLEHVCNISYPGNAINGTTSYQSLMAHELAHHWWGNSATPEKCAEMWLSEGFAYYSEMLLSESLNGYDTYIDQIKSNHVEMVHHISRLEGLRALNDLSDSIFFGYYSYRKGADIVHTMRGYLGDSLFKIGLTYVQQQKKKSSINSVELGQLLTTATGVNMNQFVSDWVLNPGWPHFSIDSVSSVSAGGGNYNITVYVRQRLYQAPAYYSFVPLEITCKNNLFQSDVKHILVSGQLSSFTFTLPYNPVYTGINVQSKISDAISSAYQTIKNTGIVLMPYTNVFLNVQNAGIDSSWVRIEHNFVKPDSVKNNVNNYRLNDHHYWKVDGIFGNGFRTKAVFSFDGRKAYGSTQYLDTLLTATNADSMILLYRANTAADWQEVNKYSKVKNGGVNGKYGYFTVDTLKAGEYTTANGVSAVLIGLDQEKPEKPSVVIFPNPARNYFDIEIDQFDHVKKYSFQLFDASGKKVREEQFNGSSLRISTIGLTNGQYFAKFMCGKQLLSLQKVIVSN